MKPPYFKLVVVRSTDIGSAVAFYRCLGIEFQEEQHGSGPCHFAADLGGIVFEIYPTKKLEDVDRTTRLGLSVADIHASITSIRELGATIVEEPKESPAAEEFPHDSRSLVCSGFSGFLRGRMTRFGEEQPS